MSEGKHADLRKIQMPLALLYLLGLYAGVLVTGIAGGSKIVAFGPITLSATVFPYAASFWITDAVGEIWGQKMATRFVSIGFVAILVGTFFLTASVYMPPAPGYTGQSAFETVFVMTPRLVAAGLSAYLLSQVVNVFVFHRIKTMTGGRHLWLRNNVSTMLSQFLDTVVFITAAFYGVFPNIWSVILGQYLAKVMVAALDTPMLYLALAMLKRRQEASDQLEQRNS